MDGGPEFAIDALRQLLPVFSGGGGGGAGVAINDRLHESFRGKLRLVTGPMSSGKTSHLITLCSEIDVQRIASVVIRSTRDTRSRTGAVESFSGARRPCFCCTDELLGDARVLAYLAANAQVIFVDEAQFFDARLVQFCRTMVDEHHKCVYVYGLNGDSDRRPFGHMCDLLPLCDSIEMLTGFCATCRGGKPGVFSRALVPKRQQCVVGSQGAEYATQCRQCYNRPVKPRA